MCMHIIVMKMILQPTMQTSINHKRVEQKFVILSTVIAAF